MYHNVLTIFTKKNTARIGSVGRSVPFLPHDAAPHYVPSRHDAAPHRLDFEHSLLCLFIYLFLVLGIAVSISSLVSSILAISICLAKLTPTTLSLSHAVPPGPRLPPPTLPCPKPSALCPGTRIWVAD